MTVDESNTLQVMFPRDCLYWSTSCRFLSGSVMTLLQGIMKKDSCRQSGHNLMQAN